MVQFVCWVVSRFSSGILVAVVYINAKEAFSYCLILNYFFFLLVLTALKVTAGFYLI